MKIDKDRYAIAGLDEKKVKVFNQNLEVLKNFELHTDAAKVKFLSSILK